MKRLRVILILLLLGLTALLAAVLAVLDTTAADDYLARALPRWAEGAGYQLSLGGLDLEPWAASLTLDGVVLERDPGAGGSLDLTVRQVGVRLRLLQSLLGTPHLDLSLDGPQLRGTLPAAGASAGTAEGEGTRVPGLVLHTLELTDGSLHLHDRGRDLELVVGAVQVGWVQDAGGGSAREVRIRWGGGEDRLDRIEFAGTRRFATLRLDRLDVEGPRVRLRTRGRVGPWRLLDLELEGDVALDGLPESWIEAARLTRFAPLGGDVTVAGRLTGSTRRPEFEGTFRLGDGKFGTVQDASLSTEVEVNQDGLRFRGLQGISNVVEVEELNGQLRWEDGVQLEARGKAREYRLRPFMGILFPRHHFPVGLAADAEFQVEGLLHPELALAVRGEARVRDLDVTTGPEGQLRTHFALPAGRLRTQCTVGRHEISFGPSRVETGSLDVDVSGGRIVYREGMWFSTVAEIRDLTLARPLLPNWIDGRGRAEGQFGGPYRELEFTYDVDLSAVSLRGHQLGRLRGHGEYDLRDLVVTDGHLIGPIGELFASGAVTLLPGGEHGWDVRWEQGDLEAAAGLVRGLGGSIPVELAGTVVSQGRLAGPLAGPEYVGTAQLAGLRADRFSIEQAHLEGAASPSGWRVPRAELEAYGTRAFGSGAGGPEKFRAKIDVAGLEVGAFLEQIGAPLPVDGVFGGQVRAYGRYPAARVAVQGHATSASAYGIPLPNNDLKLELDRDLLELSASALEGRLQASLRRAFADGVLNAEASAREVPWSALPGVLLPAGLTGTSVTGTVELQADAAEQLTAHWRGTVRGTAWQELKLGDLGFQGDYDAGSVGFHLELWDRSLQLDGLVSPEAGAPVELELALDGFSLPNLSPYLTVSSGVADGKGRALLGWEQWQSTQGLRRLSALADLEMDAAVETLRDARGLELPNLQVHVASPDGRPRWRVTGRGVEFDGEVEDLDRATWRMQARLEQFSPWPLLPVVGPAGELSGHLSGNGRLRGAGKKVTDAEGSGRLEAFSWVGWGRSDWDWDLAYRESRFTGALREPRGVSLTAGWDPSGGLDADLTLREVSLEDWMPESGPAVGLSGVLEGRGSLVWQPAMQPRGNLELTDLVLRWPPVELASDSPVRVRWDGNTVELESFSAKGAGVQVSAEGTVEPMRSWDLKAQGTVDLATLAVWLPQVERGQGPVELGLEVHGPWGAPQLQGPVEILAGATLKLTDVPVALEDLDAAGSLEGNSRFTLDWLDAQIREGRLHLEGGLDLEQWRPAALRFYGEIRDLDLQWPAQVEYRFDADALVTGTVSDPQVRGEVRLQEFLYSRSINWRRLILDALDRKPRQVETRAEGGIFVDLAVHGGDDVRVENNLAELELAADLRVRGYLPDPTLWGRVDVVDGTVSFRGREYEAMESTVEFLGETQPVPQLDLHAQTQTRDYTVNVDVTGPLDQYQVGLSSVPYLAHTDIVALLTLGMTSEEMQDAGNFGGVEAASILTEGLQEEFSAVGGVFGVDMFHIDPSYSPATQTTVPRVTVGKAVTEELFARYSAAVGAETQQNVEVEYTLNPRISLLGTWVDRETADQGSLGGEVRFRFPFR